MKAMVLAAGLATRLRPLTDECPKALVEIAGRTLLDITLSRLRSVGVREMIVNVHHFAGMVVEYLQAHDNFGMRIEISREDPLLDTGGGLKTAAWFFLENSSEREQPFVLHNVDVLSTIDLTRMMQFHTENRALATLAVQQRESSRYLLFDQQGQVCGRRFVRDDRTELARPAEPLQQLAFTGIHVISPRLLEMMTEDGAFSIIETYLRLAARGEKLFAFRADESYWRDLGTLENLRQAEQDIRSGVLNY
jgi:NDP-sugar pyrophosphorylase family protein